MGKIVWLLDVFFRIFLNVGRILILILFFNCCLNLLLSVRLFRIYFVVNVVVLFIRIKLNIMVNNFGMLNF